MNPNAILRYWVFISRTHICIVYILTRHKFTNCSLSFCYLSSDGITGHLYTLFESIEFQISASSPIIDLHLRIFNSRASSFFKLLNLSGRVYEITGQ